MHVLQPNHSQQEPQAHDDAGADVLREEPADLLDPPEWMRTWSEKNMIGKDISVMQVRIPIPIPMLSRMTGVQVYKALLDACLGKLSPERAHLPG